MITHEQNKHLFQNGASGPSFPHPALTSQETLPSAWERCSAESGGSRVAPEARRRATLREVKICLERVQGWSTPLPHDVMVLMTSLFFATFVDNHPTPPPPTHPKRNKNDNPTHPPSPPRKTKKPRIQLDGLGTSTFLKCVSLL